MHGTLSEQSVDLHSYLKRAKSLGYREQIFEAFARADKLKIAFVGELIIDEYVYVRVLGKSAKECILAACEVRREQFLGGAHAASLHGEWPLAEYVPGAEPLRKTRFVDSDFGRKLFEVYDKSEMSLVGPVRELFHARLCEAVKDADVVVALDFGHGLLDMSDRAALQNARFLAANAQTNAGNYGFNPVTRYYPAQYVCVDEPEARIAMRDQHGPLDDVILGLGRNLMPDGKLVVTRGRYGSAACTNGEIAWVPPITVGGLDTMGAGDAFLAVTAPLIAAGLDLEAAAMVGNVAGAIKVGILGHQRHVTRVEICQTVDELLA